MELNESRVLERFRLYSGESADGSDPEREALCEGLCKECAAWVAGQLRTGLTEDDALLAALESLAAAEAFYQLTLLDEALAPENVSTPEVKLELGHRAERALRLAEEKRRACAPLLKETGFFFSST